MRTQIHLLAGHGGFGVPEVIRARRQRTAEFTVQKQKPRLAFADCYFLISVLRQATDLLGRQAFYFDLGYVEKLKGHAVTVIIAVVIRLAAKIKIKIPARLENARNAPVLKAHAYVPVRNVDFNDIVPESPVSHQNFRRRAWHINLLVYRRARERLSQKCEHAVLARLQHSAVRAVLEQKTALVFMNYHFRNYRFHFALLAVFVFRNLELCGGNLTPFQKTLRVFLCVFASVFPLVPVRFPAYLYAYFASV
ncbi:MAG: hypothetical protein LBP79_01475 [Clostridiales bacterium]|nr:hypothetical protein [Clostridiales bacterium]